MNNDTQITPVQVAWMRRWYYEKEKEYKVLNPKTGRMGLANKFKWLPITTSKICEDDIPLFILPNELLSDAAKRPIRSRDKHPHSL